MNLLFVCMGNICRSPTARGIFEHHCRSLALEVVCESAGTHAYHVGEPPDPRAARIAQSRGIDILDDRARQVCAEDFERFDIIFAMDRSNLAVLEQRRPAGARARLRLIMDLVPDYGLDEVPDPYYGGEAGFRQVVDMLDSAARAFLRELAGREV